MPENFPLFVIVGVVFGSLAGVSAYLIAYHEYRRQFLPPDGPSAAQRARRTGIVTFLFFLIASCALPWMLEGIGR